MKLTVAQIGCIILAGLMLAGVVYVGIDKYSTNKKIQNMANELAASATTIEVQKGVYAKATLQITNLQDLLTSKDEQVVALNKELKDTKQQLLTATSLVITWKNKYEALVKATQDNTVPPVIPGDPNRIKVSFTHDFGPMIVSGYTLTSPPEAFISVAQGVPLKLTLAISQDPQLVWHTFVASNDSNLQINIALTAVNPYLTSVKWYERLSLATQIAAGAGGFLGGMGIGVDISNFTVSAMIWDHSSDFTKPMVGLGLSWRPFK